MAKLQRYTSFEALKLNEKSSAVSQRKDVAHSEFEAFIKKLQSEFSTKKKTETRNGKQFN